MDGLLPDVLKSIPKPEAIPAELDVEISDVQYLASYNWIDAKTPTIVVPGSFASICRWYICTEILP